MQLPVYSARDSIPLINQRPRNFKTAKQSFKIPKLRINIPNDKQSKQISNSSMAPALISKEGAQHNQPAFTGLNICLSGRQSYETSQNNNEKRSVLGTKFNNLYDAKSSISSSLTKNHKLVGKNILTPTFKPRMSENKKAIEVIGKFPFKQIQKQARNSLSLNAFSASKQNINKIKREENINQKDQNDNISQPLNPAEQSNRHIQTLLTIKQKIRQLRLSQSIQPIVQPYRDKSIESYFYGARIHGRDSHSSGSSAEKIKVRSNALQDYINPSHIVYKSVNQSPSSQKQQQKIQEQNTNTIPRLVINLSNQKQRSQKIHIYPGDGVTSLNEKLKKEDFGRDQKRLSLSLQVQKQKQKNLQRQMLQQKVAKQLLRQRQLRQQNHKQLIQKMKQITQKSQQLQLSIEDELHNFKRNQQLIHQKANHKIRQQNLANKIELASKQYVINSTENAEQVQIQIKQKKNESQAQKCAKITVLYQPFSLNLSSNHKSKQPQVVSKELKHPHPAQSQIPKNNLNFKKGYQRQVHNDRKQPAQNKLQKIRNGRILSLRQSSNQNQLQKFQDQDKWDRILNERKKKYHNNSQKFQQQSQQANRKGLNAQQGTNKKVQSLQSVYVKNKDIEELACQKTHRNKNYHDDASSLVNVGLYSQYLQQNQTIKKENLPIKLKPQGNMELVEFNNHSGNQITSDQFCQKMKMIADYFNRKSEIEQNKNIMRQISNKSVSQNMNEKARIKYSDPDFYNINLNLNRGNGNEQTFKSSGNTDQARIKNVDEISRGRIDQMSQMKYSYSFEQANQDQFRYQKQLFNRFLNCKHVQWLLIYQQMIKRVEVSKHKQLGLKSSIQSHNERRNTNLITFVKIGDNGQTIYQNRIIAHYIGIWVLTMGYNDPEVKQRVTNNVQLMFTHMDDIISKDCQTPLYNQSMENDRQAQQSEGNIKQIVQVMYNNLLYGYLPGDLQLKALLQVCRRGWQYFTFLVYRILKILLKINKKTKIKLGYINTISTLHNISTQNEAFRLKDINQIIEQGVLYKKLQQAIEGSSM